MLDRHEIDWPALAPEIATALWGEPKTRTRNEWRWGNKGSRKIDLQRGTWSDFESGETGQPITALIRRELSCDTRQTFDWLREHGFIEDDTHQSPERVRSRPAPRPRPPPKQKPETKSPTEPLAIEILAKAVGPVGTPAERYLIERHVWPPDNRAPPVKWIPRRAFPVALPPRAAGAIVFPLVGKDGPAPACQWTLVDTNGIGPDRDPSLLYKGRKRNTYGSPKDRLFYGNRPSYDPPPVTIVCEGPIDALAAYWMHKWSRALIVAQTGMIGKNFPLWPFLSGVPVIIEPDRDKPEKRDALKQAEFLQDRLQKRGVTVTITPRTADDVTEELEIVVRRDGWEPRLRKEST